MGGFDWGLTDECNRCYEVMCVDGAERGTPQSKLGPWKGCLDAGKKSVVVKVRRSAAREYTTQCGGAHLGQVKSCSSDSAASCALPRARAQNAAQITDSCPCFHPNTGNRRWCCGDALHLDLSYLAFDAIAQGSMGVVDLKIRAADCSRWGQLSSY